MVNIPTNNSVNTEKDALISRIVNCLNVNDTFCSYKYTDGYPLSLVKEVCSEFANKGYHGKIVYFCDGRSAYQRFEISKNYLQESQARMVYSEMY